MTLNANAVKVAGTGEVYIGAADAAAPAIASTPTGGLGYTTPEGVTFTMSRDTSDIDGWQASKIRTVTNAEPTTVAFTLIQTSQTTLPVVFGGGTATAIGYTPPAEGTNTVRSMTVRFVDGSYTYQYHFPRVQIEGDVSFSLTRSDAVGYGITFGVLANTPRWTLATDDPNFS